MEFVSKAVGAAPSESSGASVAAIAATHADAVDREGRIPTEAMDALRAEGLLGLLVPARFGGPNGRCARWPTCAACCPKAARRPA